MRTRSLLTAAAAATLLVLPGAAQASDHGIQKTVVRAENVKLIPAAVAFSQSARAFATEPNATPDDLLAKTGRFRNALTYAKHRVVPLHSQTARYAEGKKAFLTALREYDLGLVQYLKALKGATSATPADRTALRAKLKTFAKRITAAAKDEKTALGLLGIGAAK